MAAAPSDAADIKKEVRLSDLYQRCANPETLFDWLRREGFLIDLKDAKCLKCGESNFQLKKDSTGATYKTDRQYWQCRRCSSRASIRSDSWFAGTRLSIPQLLLFTYFWVYRAPIAFIQRELGIQASATSNDWHKFCQEVCHRVLEQESKPIGGPNTVVDLREFKFSRGKNSKTQKVKETWVFTGIEQSDYNQCFVVRVTNCIPATLIPLIKKFIKPGTVIVSEGWRPYSQLANEGFVREAADHHIEIVDRPSDQKKRFKKSSIFTANCQPIPSTTVYDSKVFDSDLTELIFRQRYLAKAHDKFTEFLRKASLVYPAKELQPPAP